MKPVGVGSYYFHFMMSLLVFLVIVWRSLLSVFSLLCSDLEVVNNNQNQLVLLVLVYY